MGFCRWLVRARSVRMLERDHQVVASNQCRGGSMPGGSTTVEEETTTVDRTVRWQPARIRKTRAAASARASAPTSPAASTTSTANRATRASIRTRPRRACPPIASAGSSFHRSAGCRAPNAARNARRAHPRATVACAVPIRAAGRAAAPVGPANPAMASANAFRQAAILRSSYRTETAACGPSAIWTRVASAAIDRLQWIAFGQSPLSASPAVSSLPSRRSIG
jgi:hypothetical protein